jgi:cytoskeletal protein RodZ
MRQTPLEANPSVGQTTELPVQDSATSQAPLAMRQTTPEPATRSAGHEGELPSHISIASQTSARPRQTVPPPTTMSAPQVSAPLHVSATSQPPGTAARQTVLALAGVLAGHAGPVPVQLAPRSQGRFADAHDTLESAYVCGHASLEPSQKSVTSQGAPELARHIVPAATC